MDCIIAGILMEAGFREDIKLLQLVKLTDCCANSSAFFGLVLNWTAVERNKDVEEEII